MSRKLQDIRQAVAEYKAHTAKEATTLYAEYQAQDYKEGFHYWLMVIEERYAAKFANALPDILAIAEAAQAMRAEIKNIPQTVMTHHMYDVVADYDKALAKLEGK